MLDWCGKINDWSCSFFWWFIGQQVICTNVQDEMVRTAPYRSFYVIVHTCRFCTWKSFNKYFIICIQFFGHFPSIKVSYHTVSYDKYKFFVLFSFWFVIFVITCCNYFFVSYNYYPVILRLRHVLVDLFRCIFLLFILLDFFSFIAETTWSVFMMALLAIDVFLCFVVVCN